MPNRILRDWTASDKINSLNVFSERFFTRLIMKVDDYGCFYSDTRLLKANLFPLLLDNIREADLLRWIAECEKAGLIVLYEVSNKKYLQIKDFNQRLDRAKSKFPLPITNDSLAVDIDYPPEKKPKPKPKQKEEEVHPRGNSDSEILFTIEHCLTVSMNDERWLDANKASKKELLDFNWVLEKRGIYEKNPLDYKNHFANWKVNGKKEEIITNNGMPLHLKKLNQ